MKLHYLLLLPCLAWAATARADIYKRVDADGNVTYSNTPIRGGKKIELEPLPTVGASAATDSRYKEVKPATQRNRDAARRRVLESELQDEEQLLVEARQSLKETTGKPALLRTADHAEEVKSAQEQVHLHERNVQAIKQELSSIK
jgi:hypothetical protein